MVQKMPAALRFVPPMECKNVPRIPEGEDWQYELKLDGYRAIAVKQSGELMLYSRYGNSFNADFPSIVDAVEKLRPKRFVIDGEIVALDEEGRHSFNLLQRSRGKPIAALQFYLFDVLHLDQENLMQLPLSKRRAELENAFHLLPQAVQISPVLKGDAKTVVQNIAAFEFEGVVAKRRDSVYIPGKAPGTWQKHKTQESDDFLIGGYIPGSEGIDQLVVGEKRGKEFFYVEAIKNGFVPATRERVFEAIKDLEIEKCPFVNLPETKGAHRMDREKMNKTRWVKPRVVCEIAFNERTRSGHLRHSRFLRLRDDFDRRR
jgi:bifunctional non-homologous end joining protein LigD